MWLLDGEPAPSDSTITRFMRGHLAEVIEDLFYQFVAKICEIGEVKFRNLFVDGTKILFLCCTRSQRWLLVMLFSFLCGLIVNAIL